MFKNIRRSLSIPALILGWVFCISVKGFRRSLSILGFRYNFVHIGKKFLKELTRVREIKFVSYETDEEIQERLHKELNAKKQEIMQTNYKKLMSERLIPYVRDCELTQNGILLSDVQCFEVAHNLYLCAKQDGRLDELNSIIVKEQA